MDNKPIRTKYKNLVEYTLNGETHREDGPAVIWNSGISLWYKNGLLHRIDGPAIIYDSGTMFWYINGKKTT